MSENSQDAIFAMWLHASETALKNITIQNHGIVNLQANPFPMTVPKIAISIVLPSEKSENCYILSIRLCRSSQCPRLESLPTRSSTSKR
jgi:hypothetical protein